MGDAERPAKAKPGGRREGTELGLPVDVLRRPEGASVEPIVPETGWLAHSVRGAMTPAFTRRSVTAA
jgi:hypothetical protein